VIDSLLPGAGGAGPNRGNKGISLKDYFLRMAELNVIKCDKKCTGGRGYQFCINEGDGTPDGAGPSRGKL